MFIEEEEEEEEEAGLIHYTLKIFNLNIKEINMQ
jgi:hypothetical protein